MTGSMQKLQSLRNRLAGQAGVDPGEIQALDDIIGQIQGGGAAAAGALACQPAGRAVWDNEDGRQEMGIAWLVEPPAEGAHLYLAPQAPSFQQCPGGGLDGAGEAMGRLDHNSRLHGQRYFDLMRGDLALVAASLRAARRCVALMASLIKDAGGWSGAIESEYQAAMGVSELGERGRLEAAELAQWLDLRYCQHGEDEDRQAAELIRRLDGPGQEEWLDIPVFLRVGATAQEQEQWNARRAAEARSRAKLVAMGMDGLNFRGESLDQVRGQLVDMLKAGKSWMTEYAHAYLDDFIALSLAGGASEVAGAGDMVCPACEKPGCVPVHYSSTIVPVSGAAEFTAHGLEGDRCPHCMEVFVVADKARRNEIRYDAARAAATQG